tara:strand:+ start:2253 stop:2834 length:582 start_codon:yes stop_codon:yes gene_type:complete
MVKLRSGYIYLDVKSFNDTIKRLHTIVKKKNLFLEFQKRFKNDVNEIIYLDKKLNIKKGKRGGNYFDHNGTKLYLTEKSFYKINNIRLNILENIWLKVSNILVLFKQFVKINYIKYNGNCLICYDKINKDETLNVCISEKNIKHIFHEYCFKESLKYFSNYHPLNTDTDTDRLKSCPYCNKKTIDKYKIYICK